MSAPAACATEWRGSGARPNDFSADAFTSAVRDTVIRTPRDGPDRPSAPRS
ncbi:hypothetical protein ACFC8N_24850 [Streptomyces sp. NPDC055966]|uniref:hypothetical protein n=1 Tax=Streptomyces sp. NPDC055966 TaxID=3345669 RepID=UPI0035D99C2F